MTIIHIKANDASSIDAAVGDALGNTTSGTLIVDADAFLISESGTFGAFLTSGPWTVTINGTVAGFSNIGLGVSGQSFVTIGSTGDVYGGVSGVRLIPLDGSRVFNAGNVSGIYGVKIEPVVTATLSIVNAGTITGKETGLFLQGGTNTIVNTGTISGAVASIMQTSGTAHIINSGALLGGFLGLGNGDDILTNFKKTGTVIKNGTITGVIHLGGGDDHFNGGAKAETVNDGSGSDIYKFGGGNDTYLAVKTDPGTDLIDTVDGGKGIDTYDASAATSVVINLDIHDRFFLIPVPHQISQGTEVSGGNASVHDTVFNFENVIGGSDQDIIVGSVGANVIDGGAGDDIIVGLGGRDILTGGGGVGQGVDTFVYTKLSDSGPTASTRDLITDFFSAKDGIILSDIDANSKLVGDQDFNFIGFHHFHHAAGELRETFSNGNTLILGDVNGDGRADFSIALKGHVDLASTDFGL